MKMATTTTTPLTHSIFQSLIFRNKLWHRNITTATKDAARTRFTRFPLLQLPSILHLPYYRLPLSNRYLLSNPPLRPLLRSRPPPLPSPMTSLASPSDSINPTKTVRVVIKGRVQGVFYRNWTVDNATELGLKGWVRNRRDGSVEALFSGSPDKVQEMEQRCRRGPPAAMVTGLQVFPSDDDPGTGFERRPSV